MNAFTEQYSLTDSGMCWPQVRWNTYDTKIMQNCQGIHTSDMLIGVKEEYVF